MPASQYERLQIESLLRDEPHGIERGMGLFITPAKAGMVICDAAVMPAMRSNGLNLRDVKLVFDDESPLSDIYRSVQSAEVIVVDLSDANPQVMYVLGTCHALRRCPLMIAAKPLDLPFNLHALRCIAYESDTPGLFELRAWLERAIRSFLLAARGREGN
jgi:hypothetical protein